MDYAKIDFGPRMNRVDQGNRMGRLPRPEGESRVVGTCVMGIGETCEGFDDWSTRRLVMYIDRMMIGLMVDIRIRYADTSLSIELGRREGVVVIPYD